MGDKPNWYERLILAGCAVVIGMIIADFLGDELSYRRLIKYMPLITFSWLLLAPIRLIEFLKGKVRG